MTTQTQSVEEPSPKKKLFNINRDDAVAKSLGSLFMDDATSDVTLIVEGRRFPGHKAILSARCEYFKALFYNGMQESTKDEIVLKGHGNLKKDIFEPILEYIYSGKMDVQSKDTDTIMEILGEAHYFSMSELVDEILAYLKEANQDNLIKWSFKMLLFAETHSNHNLKEECFKELEVYPDKAILDEDLGRLSAKTLEELISRDSFSALEENIFHAVIRWIMTFKPGVAQPLEDGPCPEVKSLLAAVRLSQFNESFLEAQWLRKYFSADKILDALVLRKSNCFLKRKDRGVPRTVPLPVPDRLQDSITAAWTPRPIYFGSVIAKTALAGKSFLIQLPRQSIVNSLLFNLKQEPKPNYSLCVELSIRDGEWQMVADLRDYCISSSQLPQVPIFFYPRAARQIRITIATAKEWINDKLTKDMIFVKAMYIHGWQSCKPDIRGNLYVDLAGNPRFFKGDVIKTILPNGPSGQLMLNGSLEHSIAQGEEIGFTSHEIVPELTNYASFSIDWPYTAGRIILGTSSVFWADKIKFMLPTGNMSLGDQAVFQYRVYVSRNGLSWHRVCDNSDAPCRGWQTVQFELQPIAYIMLQGVDSTLMVNGQKTFGIVQFEWPVKEPRIDAEPSSRRS